MTTHSKGLKRFSGVYSLIAAFSRNRKALIGLIAFLSIASIGVFAPLIAPYEPFQLTGTSLVPPSDRFLMGTDDLSRDILSGVIYGSRASLVVGITSAVISALIGIFIGSIAGFFGGKGDLVLMTLTEVFQVLPTFVFALAILALFGSSFANVILAIAIVSWPANARLVRSSVLSVKEQPFVTAAKALGRGNFKIIFYEILPNILPTVIVNTTLQVAAAITAESGLGFLGLGDPRIMSWGLMLGNARSYLIGAWWMMTFPGISILVIVLALHFVADGINLALNPKRERY